MRRGLAIRSSHRKVLEKRLCVPRAFRRDIDSSALNLQLADPLQQAFSNTEFLWSDTQHLRVRTAFVKRA